MRLVDYKKKKPVSSSNCLAALRLPGVLFSLQLTVPSVTSLLPLTCESLPYVKLTGALLSVNSEEK